jgi:prevent-host-death family protein
MEPSMQRTVEMGEFRGNFNSLLDEVAKQHTSLVLTRGSRPQAVIIPYEDFLRFQQVQEREVLAGFDRVWNRLAELNAAYSEAEIDTDVMNE